MRGSVIWEIEEVIGSMMILAAIAGLVVLNPLIFSLGWLSVTLIVLRRNRRNRQNAKRLL